MALLPTTSLTTTAIGNALSNASRNLRVLCTDVNLNNWSRYKPGYFESDGSADKFLTYQAPQGGGFTDPRGFNSDSQSSLEGYRMGDFRAYNHDANIPYVQFPSVTIEFGSGTSISFGISITFYAEEVDWSNTGVYRSTNNWPTFTHVHALDASDDSIQGTAVLPAIGGNVSIPLDGVSLIQGSIVTKTYHLAFGVDSTHWSIKLGANYGAGGIGDVDMLQLNARIILEADFDDITITGGANDPYTDVTIPGGTTNSFAGSNVATWKFDGSNPSFRCWYNSGASFDDYTRLNADWLIKGFKDEPSAEYIVGTADIFGNSGSNSVTLPPGGLLRSGGGANSPNTFGDGDNITLIFRNITIVF